jgi:two-component system nitrate/nitrite response regulator NarL
MGGTIGIERSDPGEGTVFHVDLPLAAADTVPASGYFALRDTDPLEAVGVLSGTVLYVEDNLANLDLVNGLFARVGDVQVVSAVQGRVGIELAARHHPDLVLLDLHLPDLDGDEVLRRLRADPRTADIPVIVLSADATRDQIERLKQAGASDYVTKPIDVPVFLRAVGDRARPVTAVGKRTRLLVADDHPLYHEGVARAVSTAPWLELVARVELARDALDEIRRLKPDVALVDLGLPDLDGIAVLELLKPDALDTRVVIVSASEDRAMVYRAIAAGARAYLSKVSRASTLLATMQAGLAEEIRARQATGDQPVLTARELEVLRHTAEGMSAPEIAQELVLGVTTVKTHLHNIYGKLGVSDRAAAVATAIRRGLLG